MAYRRDQPVVPKPYGFVPIAALEKKHREKPKGHEQYFADTVNGCLKAALVVTAPLHVGSGHIHLRSGQNPPLVRGLTRVNGVPCVPASTLKGVVRAVVEAITYSCVRITRARNLPQGATEYRDKSNLCLACRMFGALGFEGHIRFSDALLTGDERDYVKVARMPALYAPRSRSGAYIDNYDRPKGLKFYQHGRTVTDSQTPVETLVPESHLTFSVWFENLTEGELGVLLTALGLGDPGLTLKLGGGKPACYGSALVKLDALEVWDMPQTLYAEYDIAPTPVNIESYLEITAQEQLVITDNLKRLAQLWTYDMKRQCPTGGY